MQAEFTDLHSNNGGELPFEPVPVLAPMMFDAPTIFGRFSLRVQENPNQPDRFDWSVFGGGVLTGAESADFFKDSDQSGYQADVTDDDQRGFWGQRWAGAREIASSPKARSIALAVVGIATFVGGGVAVSHAYAQGIEKGTCVGGQTYLGGDPTAVDQRGNFLAWTPGCDNPTQYPPEETPAPTPTDVPPPPADTPTPITPDTPTPTATALPTYTATPYRPDNTPVVNNFYLYGGQGGQGGSATIINSGNSRVEAPPPPAAVGSNCVPVHPYGQQLNIITMDCSGSSSIANASAAASVDIRFHGATQPNILPTPTSTQAVFPAPTQVGQIPTRTPR